MHAFKRLLDLVYPQTCSSCKEALQHTEAPICISCVLNLPVIVHDTTQQIKIRQKFDGKVNINDAKSYLLFQKGNVAQKLIYDLKYNDNKNLGKWLGRKFAEELINSDNWEEIDLIIPIPLNAQKHKLRGYNQAELIAEGMSAVLNIPVMANGLVKTKHNPSQTKKDRYERFLNTSNIFEVNDVAMVRNKRICLVDDVLTTGATLEAASEKLLNCGCSVHIKTIASAI